MTQTHQRRQPGPKRRHCVFFFSSAAAAGATYSTGLTLKAGDGLEQRAQSGGVKAGATVHHHPPFNLHVLLPAALAEAGMTDCLSCPGLRFAGGRQRGGGLMFDHPADSSLREGFCQTSRVNIQILTRLNIARSPPE